MNILSGTVYQRKNLRLAVIAAVSAYTNSKNTSTTSYSSSVTGPARNGNNFGMRQGQQNLRPGTPLHGNINILLGGAMLSVLTIILCVVFYCCHRNIKKRSSLYRQRWQENDPNNEIYSVEQCYETSGLFPDNFEGFPISNHGEPPPSYDTVLAMDQIAGRSSHLPRYNSSEFNEIKTAGSTQDNCNLCTSNGQGNLAACQSSLFSEGSEVASASSAQDTHRSETISSRTEKSFYFNGCPLCGKISYASTAVDNDFESQINSNMEIGRSGANCHCPLKSPLTSTENQLNGISFEIDSRHNRNCFLLPSSETNSNSIEDDSLNNNLPVSVLAEEETEEGNLLQNPREANLEFINNNGIVRVDMSRIIDKTGLPTYDAALKLDSSGYV